MAVSEYGRLAALRSDLKVHVGSAKGLLPLDSSHRVPLRKGKQQNLFFFFFALVLCY